MENTRLPSGDIPVWNNALRRKYHFPSQDTISGFLQKHPLTNRDVYYQIDLIDTVASVYADQNLSLEQFGSKLHLRTLLKNVTFSAVQAENTYWDFVEALIDLMVYQKTIPSQNREPQEAEEQIRALQSKQFTHIKDLQGVTPFVGKIVAFASRHYFPPASPINPLDEIHFGYVEPEIISWQREGEGHNLARLIDQNEVASACALTETQLHSVYCNLKIATLKEPKKFSYFCMREATYEEVLQMQKSVRSGEKKMSFLYPPSDPSVLEQIFEKHLNRLKPPLDTTPLTAWDFCVVI